MPIYMEELQRKLMIEDYLHEICSFFKGPKMPVPPDELREMYRNSNYKGMIRYIQKQLLLGNLNLTWARVKSGGPDKKDAWIPVPVPMPRYGTTEFKNLKLDVYIRNRVLLENRFENLVAVIVHELCHPLLRSLDHKLKESEEATDLTAMCLGYHDFYLSEYESRDRQYNGIMKMKDESATEYLKRLRDLSRGIRTEGKRYLSTSEIRFAHEWIKKRIKG